MSDPTRESALAALSWLVEAGADEAVSETPIDRFAPPASTTVDSAMPPPAALKTQTARPGAIARSAEAVSLSTAPGVARALAASCKTLSELKVALENFEGCELKRLATKTVFADGNPDSRVMFIGEAPGRDEDREGLPFVGRAGKLLDRMLEAIGRDRTKVYITNVLPWRPPKNRDPSPEEAAVCLPFLHRHIELADPAVLVLLGKVAVRHVLGLTEGIMRLRGRWEVYQSAAKPEGIPVLLTLHPAYLLRQPSAKRLAWRDFLALAERLEQLAPA